MCRAVIQGKSQREDGERGPRFTLRLTGAPYCALEAPRPLATNASAYCLAPTKGRATTYFTCPFTRPKLTSIGAPPHGA
jgi:hypothetical protein